MKRAVRHGRHNGSDQTLCGLYCGFHRPLMAVQEVEGWAVNVTCERCRQRMNATTPRELLADWTLLREYNAARLRLGNDYGAGQRAGELMRRRGMLEQLHKSGELELEGLPLELDELRAAFDRVGRRRWARAKHDAEYYGSAGCRKSLKAWDAIRARYAPDVEVSAAG